MMAKYLSMVISLVLAGFAGNAQHKLPSTASETMTRAEEVSESKANISRKGEKDKENLKIITLSEEEIQKARLIEYEIDVKNEKQLKSNKLSQEEKERVSHEFDVMKQKLLIETLGQEHYKIYKDQF